MKKTTTKKAPSNARVVTAPAEHPEITGTQADYETYLIAARALEARDVVPCRADLNAAYHNVEIGVAALVARRVDAEKLPGIDIDALVQLPRMVLATDFASRQVHGPSAGLVKAQLVRARVLRRLVLKTAVALAEAGLLPPEKVARIEQGRGPIDTAQDCVDLPALFATYATATKGKHALSAATLKESAELGATLTATLRAKGTKKRRSDAETKAADIRDRLWTLVNLGYDLLWKDVAFLVGPSAIDEACPPLQSTVHVTKKKPAKTGTTTAPATSAAAGQGATST